jgi:G3E family GTPase
VNKYAAATQTWEMLSGILQAAQMIPQSQRAPDESLPLTVIGGFLGAGKTTLLNRLLTQPHGRKIAVLVNDFGRINIDAALIRSQTEDMISLTNGCACCSVAGDLTRTLIQLAQRTEPPDAIVLEASGLADPRGIAQVALANPALRLDGVLAVVDAETLAERAADPEGGPTFNAQISAADLIVLNKLDLLEDSARRQARAWMKARAPGKPIVDAMQADVPAEVVLGINTDRDVLAEPPAGAGHADSYRSWSATSAGRINSERFRAMMHALPTAVLRAKGILWLSDDPDHLTIFQRVGPRSSYRAAEWNAEKPASSLVIIGPAGAIDPDALTREFNACREANGS